MSIYKRGRIYWYKFQLDGQDVRESTKQTNDKVARQIEAGHRSRLAKERDERKQALKRLQCEAAERCADCERWFNSSFPVVDAGTRYCSERCVSMARRKAAIVPSLQQFATERVLPWAETAYRDPAKYNTWSWHRDNIRAIRKYPEIGSLPLDRITGETLSTFAANLLHEGLAIASVNSRLRAIRKFLGLAAEWGVIDGAPKTKMLQGEHHRDRVILPEEERAYLEVASPELQVFSILLFDTGMRPAEGYQLRWERVNWKTGSIFIDKGKSRAARRTLFMSPRLRFVLEHCWETAGQPTGGWVFAVPYLKSGHHGKQTLYRSHVKALKASGVKPFMVYAIRHTFLTRLGESGCDVWTLARIAGHGSITMSQRYVHPGEDAVAKAMSRLGGHNIGHSHEPVTSENLTAVATTQLLSSTSSDRVPLRSPRAT